MRLIKQLALSIPPIRHLYQDRDDLRKVANAERARARELEELLRQDQRSVPSPFTHYNTCFDAIAIMRAHAIAGLAPAPGRLTNFLGVKIDPKFFPAILDDRAGTVEGMPIPANWHADIAEWSTALRAVDLSRNRFTMIELGCGWGCWMNNTGAAARRLGRELHLIGVEGDVGHIGFAEESLSENGFAGDQFTLHHGIAAAARGVALFPRQAVAGVAWGLEPIFGATADEQTKAIESGTHDVLPMVALADIMAPHERIDLLHVDIQGGEADLIDGCLDVLTETVAYILIGTHSRQIEGRIFERLLGAGWRLEMERPAILTVDGEAVKISVDGVQGWRNPRLLP